MRGSASAAAAARLLRMPPGDRGCTVTTARVPMRDGVELLTDVHAPEGPPRGTVLIRTPYGRAGLLARLTAGWFASHGYHVVNQACRGTGGSGGDFQPFTHEVADGADTVAWLRRQPWFGGRFAVWGASYLGYTAWAVMVEPPPELAVAVIAATGHDHHWQAHGAGAFSLEEVVGLMDAFAHLGGGVVGGILRGVTTGRRMAPAFAELPLVRALDTVLAGSGMPYAEWLTSSDPEDPVWRPMRVGEALERVDVPVLLQEGWQDRFPEQMLEQYGRLRRRGVEVGLTMGPWTHAEIATRGAGVVMAEALDWLAEHLAGSGRRQRPTPVRVWVDGAREWRWLPAWPPESHERVLHLQPDGRLGDARPSPVAPPTTFTFDPADPTPAVGGRVINPARGGRRDNRRLEQRADVVTFTSAPLVEPLEVVGNPMVELVHETDNPCADLFVRLCEVAVDGRSVNVGDGFRRLAPEQANGTVRLRLDTVAHRFAPGARIRLQISGGAHPRYARNLGTDLDPATSTALVPSRRKVFHGEGGFSRVLLPCSGDVGAVRDTPPMSPTDTAIPGEDGLLRCPWGDRPADYRTYHDTEWGTPIRGESAWLERLALEAFQSGLSWLTILRKRDAFRAAFAGFDADVVAAYDESDVQRLMADAGIVRNRRKIDATVANARATVRLRDDGGLEALLREHTPAPRPPPLTLADVPATTPESTALAKALKQRGFAHVGPTTVYALMQAGGLVNDHLADCHRRAAP